MQTDFNTYEGLRAILEKETSVPFFDNINNKTVIEV